MKEGTFPPFIFVPKTFREKQGMPVSLGAGRLAEHDKKTWYHSLDDEEGRVWFMRNLKNQLEIVFGDGKNKDFEEIGFELIKNKMLKIKHYDIVVNCNHAIFRLRAKPYILDYFYKSGMGANRSRGFGFIDIEKGGI